MDPIVAPSGRKYTWDQPNPPTQADIDALVAYDKSLDSKESGGGRSVGEMQAGVSMGIPGQSPIQAVEPTTEEGKRGAKTMAGLVAGVAAPALAVSSGLVAAPASSATLASYLGRQAVLGAIGGGASGATEGAIDVASGAKTVGEAAKSTAMDTVKGALLNTVLGPAFEKLLGIPFGAVQGASAASGFAGKVKGAITGAKAGLIRPLYQAPSAAAREAASKVIEDTTGIRPQMSLGEALGETMTGKSFVDVERQLGQSAGGALSDEARTQLAEAVAYKATQLAGANASEADVAESLIGELEKKIGSVSDPAKQEIQRLSKIIVDRVNGQLDQYGPVARSAFGFGRETTEYGAGSAAKKVADQAEDLFREAESALYNKARAGVGKEFRVTPEDMTPLRRAVQEIEEMGLRRTVKGEPQTVYDQYGAAREIPGETREEVIKSAIPDAAARAYMAQIREFGETPQTLDAVRAFRTEISNAISETGVLATLGTRNKAKLAKAAFDAIEKASERFADPATKEAFKYANRHRYENIDFFKSNLAQGAGEAVEAGGLSSGTLFRKLTKDVDAYRSFKRMASGTPETQNLWQSYQNTLKDAVLTEAFESAREILPSVSGRSRVSVGKFVEGLKRTKPEILEDLGITPQTMDRLVGSEMVAKGLEGSMPKKPEKLLEWVEINEGDIRNFLQTGDVQILESAKRAAVAEADLMKNRVMSDAAKGLSNAIQSDPAAFLNGVLGAKNYTTRELSQVMDVLKDNQPAREGVQKLFLAKLLKEAESTGWRRGKIVDAAKVLKLIERAGSRKAPGGVELPTSGGDYAEVANGLLGIDKVSKLKDAMTQLEIVQKGLFKGRPAKDPGILDLAVGEEGEVAASYAVIRALGQSAPLRLIATMTRFIGGGAKYRIASTLLSDESIRPLLSKPVKMLTGAEAAQLEEVVRQSMEDE